MDEDKIEESRMDDNKTDENKSDDNKTDENKSDDNNTDENKSDDNKTDENKSDDNKTSEMDGNETNENRSNDSKTDENEMGGNKTDEKKSEDTQKEEKKIVENTLDENTSENPPPPKKIDINNLLPTIGEFGRFQKLLTAILFLICLPPVYQVLIMYFSTLTPPWRCINNSTTCTLNGTQHPDDESRCKMPRGSWYYTEDKSYSLVTQFDLHCDKAWTLNLASSIIFLGWGFGSLMCGWLGDRYGRKSVFLPSVGVILVFGLITVFCTDIYQICACQFVIGFFIPGVQLQAFILISEFVGDKQRALAGILIIFTDPVSWSILALKAYFIQNWKILSMVATIPYAFVFLFYKFIPESITWLHFHGKTDELTKTARRVAEWNNKKLPETFEITGTDTENTKTNTSPLDLFRTNRDTMISFVQGFLWLVTACCYFGLHMAANDLGGGVYRDFVILNLVELPAVIVAIVGCNRLGRKPTSLFPLFIGSLSCITLAFLPKQGSYQLARIILGILGEFCLSIVFNALYTWSVEIYPLPVRNKGMAWLQVVSRLGSAGAPWMVKGLKPVSSWLPFVALGAPALLGSVISIWLPETKIFKSKNSKVSKVKFTSDSDAVTVENEHAC